MDDDQRKRLLALMTEHQEADARRRRMIEFDWRKSARRFHGCVKGNPIRVPEALQVTLSSGRVVRLSNLSQFATYAGTLSGIPPNPEITLVKAIESAEKLYPEHSRPPVILEPIFEMGTIKHVVEDATREIEWILLPPVCAIVNFDSDIGIDEDDDGSRVVVIWFQDKFGIDVDDHTRGQLRAIDWERYAEGWSW